MPKSVAAAVEESMAAAAREAAASVAAVVEAFPQTHRSFADRVANADVVQGHSLEKDKASLIGVPFMITAVVVRDGVRRPSGELTNYLSVEILTADQATLQRAANAGRMNPGSSIMPEEQVVINDGGTGIARQLVAYLHATNRIVVPDGPESGGMHASRYDTYRAEWIKGGGSVDDPRFEIDLYCPRGLRVSEYETDYTAGEAATFYLA